MQKNKQYFLKLAMKTYLGVVTKLQIQLNWRENDKYNIIKHQSIFMQHFSVLRLVKQQEKNNVITAQYHHMYQA